MVDLFESTEVFFGYYQRGFFEGGGLNNTVAPICCINGTRGDCFCGLNKKISKKAGLIRLYGISDRRNM